MADRRGGILSTRSVSYSTQHSAEINDYPIPDIDRDETFLRLFSLASQYSMTSKEVMFGLYQSVKYVHERGIDGDFVECGVWRGGSALLAAMTFQDLERHQPAKRTPFRVRPRRRFWLYDTFEGMTRPTAVDVDREGGSAQGYIDQYSDDGKWCYADLADVRNNLTANGIGEQDLRFVKGDVLETLKLQVPKKISVLRLDTDWYESTKVELQILYPRLVRGGVLIIDDYGHWEGSRKAVDEYFDVNPPPLLHRTTYAVRTAIKI
jgi:hypothetical protein